MPTDESGLQSAVDEHLAKLTELCPAGEWGAVKTVSELDESLREHIPTLTAYDAYALAVADEDLDRQVTSLLSIAQGADAVTVQTAKSFTFASSEDSQKYQAEMARLMQVRLEARLARSALLMEQFGACAAAEELEALIGEVAPELTTLAKGDYPAGRHERMLLDLRFLGLYDSTDTRGLLTQYRQRRAELVLNEVSGAESAAELDRLAQERFPEIRGSLTRYDKAVVNEEKYNTYYPDGRITLDDIGKAYQERYRRLVEQEVSMATDLGGLNRLMRERTGVDITDQEKLHRTIHAEGGVSFADYYKYGTPTESNQVFALFGIRRTELTVEALTHISGFIDTEQCLVDQHPQLASLIASNLDRASAGYVYDAVTAFIYGGEANAERLADTVVLKRGKNLLASYDSHNLGVVTDVDGEFARWFAARSSRVRESLRTIADTTGLLELVPALGDSYRRQEFDLANTQRRLCRKYGDAAIADILKRVNAPKRWWEDR